MTEPAQSFPNLFSPFTINKMTLRNRITVPPHFAGLWMSSDGAPSDAFVAYLAERAKGGAALVGVGATVVRAGDHPGYYQNLDDSFIIQYKKVADAVHRHGAKLIAQFCPRGPDIRYQEMGEPFPRPAAAGPLASVPYPGVSAEWHVSTYRRRRPAGDGFLHRTCGGPRESRWSRRRRNPRPRASPARPVSEPGRQ